MNTIRCAGCGKVVEADAKTVRVSIGRLHEGTHAEKKEWGLFHEGCFEQSIDTPASALSKVLKLAKQTTVVSPKKVAKSA